MKGSLISSEIAEPYAQALLSVARSVDVIEPLSEQVRSILELLDNSPELKDFIANPVIKEDVKKNVLARVLGDDTHPYLANFVKLLVDKRRIQFLEPVFQQYLALVREITETVLAEVTSATELSDAQKQTVIDRVKALTGARVVEIKTSVDRDLIGGVVIKVGSQVFDASIRGQLNRITLNLK